MLDRLVDGHVVNDAGDGRDEAVGIRAGVDEEVAAEHELFERMVNGEDGAGDDVLVIDVGGDADDAGGLGSEAGDEFDDGIGPGDVAVDGVLAGEHALGEGLADDDDLLGAEAVGGVKIAAGNDGDAERGEKSWGDAAELGARVFAGDGGVAFGGELEAGAEAACVAPGNYRADGDLCDGGSSEMRRTVSR